MRAWSPETCLVVEFDPTWSKDGLAAWNEVECPVLQHQNQERCPPVSSLHQVEGCNVCNIRWKSLFGSLVSCQNLRFFSGTTGVHPIISLADAAVGRSFPVVLGVNLSINDFMLTCYYRKMDLSWKISFPYCHAATWGSVKFLALTFCSLPFPSWMMWSGF